MEHPNLSIQLSIWKQNNRTLENWVTNQILLNFLNVIKSATVTPLIATLSKCLVGAFCWYLKFLKNFVSLFYTIIKFQYDLFRISGREAYYGGFDNKGIIWHECIKTHVIHSSKFKILTITSIDVKNIHFKFMSWW